MEHDREEFESRTTFRVAIAVIAASALAAIAAVCAVPRIPQDSTYHLFADHGILLGIPNALNVLSNLAFAAVGLAGVTVILLRGAELRDARERWPWLVFFVGVALTSVGSAWYHLAPSNESLVWDRLPMAVGFMGLFVAVITERIDPRIGIRLLGPMVMLGVSGVIYWFVTEQTGVGDLRPYFLVQFYPLVAIPLVLLLTPRVYTLSSSFLGAWSIYLLAKVAEIEDGRILHFGGLVSGHTIKHLLAAIGIGMLVRMLSRRRRTDRLLGPPENASSPAVSPHWAATRALQGMRPPVRVSRWLLLSMALTVASVARAQTWSQVGPMSIGRTYHSATQLADGKVLVAGGNDSVHGNAFASAELYDPQSGQWSATGSMAADRFSHTATLLPSGKVLVAGGVDIQTNSPVGSAELYDPQSGKWTPTGAMKEPRSYHTATLLPSGQVLVAGGLDPNSIAGCELYDPTSGSWTATGSMNHQRAFHLAARLPSPGKVLVLGGFDGSPVATAELYDPSTGTWSDTGSLSTVRAYHAGALLPSGKYLVTGGVTGNSQLATAELYDPSTGTWSDTGSLATSRVDHSATLLSSGEVLVVGGDGPFTQTTELYDPAAGSWSSGAALLAVRARHTALLDTTGEVLLAGGIDQSYEAVSTAEAYGRALPVLPPSSSSSSGCSSTGPGLVSISWIAALLFGVHAVSRAMRPSA
jgi:N-acetylneuraminic acid mutarotase